MFLSKSGRNQIKFKKGLQQCRPQQENRAKVLPKNQISPSFFLKKQVMKAEKIRNLKELDWTMILAIGLKSIFIFLS